MAEYLIQDTTLIEIADAIREKTGDSDGILVADMADKIKDIGGSAVETCTVTVTQGVAHNMRVGATIVESGEIKACRVNTDSITGDASKVTTITIENVLCGSMIWANAPAYSCPGYRVNYVTKVDSGFGILRAPTEAGVVGTVQIYDDM